MKHDFIHLGPKISGVELAFLSVWPLGCSLNYAPWFAGIIEWKSWYKALLIFACQVYTNSYHWCTPEELLANVQCEFCMECTMALV